MEMAAGALDEGKLLGAACRSLSETGPWPRARAGGGGLCVSAVEITEGSGPVGQVLPNAQTDGCSRGWILEGSGTSGIGKDSCQTGQKKSTAEATWKAVEQPLQVHV
jgi:hypothetical protein